MTTPDSKFRLLVFIVAYNAEKTIDPVLKRIPVELHDAYDVEVLIIDDASKDKTFESSKAYQSWEDSPFKLHVLTNPVNQGYGGNQKLGYHFAIEEGFDFVALVHGDAQYAPEMLPKLVKPLAEGEADAVQGSRMMTAFGALRGGMPLYKYVGNRILTWIQNRLLHTRLSEFHTGYRIYSVEALKKIRFELNTNVYHFDTEMIIQFLRAGMGIKEIAIPTFYGDEISHVNGMKYAWDVVTASLKARAQDLGLFYDPKFDLDGAAGDAAHEAAKAAFPSPHTLALERIGAGKRIVDLGCASGALCKDLKTRGNHVTGVGLGPTRTPEYFDSYVEHDLNDGKIPVDIGTFDHVLVLDVLDTLNSPETFLATLRKTAQSERGTTILASTANIGFFITRTMLLLGQFNYGRRGVLDLNHRRLFTFSALRRLFAQAGYDVLEIRGIPAPYPLALGSNAASRALLAINGVLIRVWKRLFAYQIFLVARPRPSLGYLMCEAYRESAARTEALGQTLVEAPTPPFPQRRRPTARSR